MAKKTGKSKKSVSKGKNASKGKKGKGKNKKSKKSKKSKKIQKIETNVIEVAPPPPPPPAQGEFICIHIGQAGIQMGSTCWEIFCLEHGINLDGKVHHLTTNSKTMFSLSQLETYVPRALLVDTDPSILDSIKNGKYQRLFPSQSIISGNESSGNNYATGFYGYGNKLTSLVMDQLAHLAEDCQSLQGIALFRSVGGGTGSGLGSRIIDNIKNAYPNKTLIDFNVCSSSAMSPVIMEPYNNALDAYHNLNTMNCSFLFDNKSLYNMVRLNYCSKLDLLKPTYQNINNIIALVTSGITSSLRFEGSMMGNFTELLKTLIPQQRLHYPLITHVPITNRSNNTLLTSTQLAVMSFDRNYQMLSINPSLGMYQSYCMMFRGDLKPTEINTTIAYIQREYNIPIIQNMNPAFKFGLCLQPPINLPHSNIVLTSTRTLTTLTNNTNVKLHWINMLESYNKFFSKRAYLHHYLGEGMEEDTFKSTDECISKLIEEYEEIETTLH